MNIQLFLMTLIAAATLQVSSPSFPANGMIPSKYTCEGASTSPAISVRGIPAGTKSLALTVFDPDAPGGGMLHWIMWNIDPSTIDIAENSAPGTQGKNGKGDNRYTGPCPPTGTHHYHFTVYALDNRPDLDQSLGLAQLQDAMKGHILASGELIGLYKKTN
jgi:Raf kinase inhibitor-like YbhB/YbcL family protein